MRRICNAVIATLFAWATAGIAAPLERPAREALAGGDHRFIEAPAGSAARFFVNGGANTIAFAAAGAQMQSARTDAKSSAANPALRFEFDAANLVEPVGLEESATRYHFIVGDRASWATDLRSYRAIVYSGVWPGVDAKWHGDKGGLKYDFTVQPGADPARIALVVSGADDARVTPEGALEWKRGETWQRDEAPLAWQDTPAGAAPVSAAYKLEKIGAASWRVKFDVGAYDRAKALVVDPAWSAFAGLVGGNAADQVYAVARDSTGNTLACGATQSINLPVTGGYTGFPGGPGAGKAFIVKFNAAGAVQFVTYLGGNAFDLCTGIALDSVGAIYVTGATTSTNFPAPGSGDANFRRSKASTLDRDAFVTKFAADGKTLGYSGYIGGTEDDQANAIAVDSSGRAYITGYTTCTATPNAGCAAGFPAVLGPRNTHGGDSLGTFGQDAFVARVAANGNSLDYSGYIGGNGGVESGRGIAVNASGEAFVVGETNSTSGLPSMAGTIRSIAGNGDGDGFLAKISSTGNAFSFFTVLTGTPGINSGTDRALGVALDSDGTIVVVGETDSDSFPAGDVGTRLTATGPQSTLAGRMDGFMLRITPTFTSVVSATYLGGDRFDTAEGVAVDGVGGVYVVGTSSPSVGSAFPTAATAGLSTTRFGAQDGFVAKLPQSVPGTFTYSGFVGASVGTGAATSNDAMHAIAASNGASSILSVGGATGAQFTGMTSGALAASGAAPNGVVLRINPNANVLLIVAGTPQSKAVSTGFPTPLQVRVQDQDGNPLSNYTVTFTPPGSGASATLTSATVVTDAAGNAQVIATANAVVGSYNVQASVPLLGSVNFALTNQFVASVGLGASASNVSVGTSITFTATVTGSSPTGGVTFNDGATVLCNAVALTGNTAQCATSSLAAGSHSITAQYSGDALNIGATSSAVTVTVRAPQSISFAALANKRLGAAPFTVSATGGASGNAVTFSSTTAAICTTGGTNGSTVTLMAAGTCTIAANQAGNASYDAAPQVTQSFGVLAAAATGDLNGDGKSDILIRNGTNGVVYGWLMNGVAIASGGYVLDAGSGWTPVRTLDLNGDGKADMLIQHTDGSIYAWIMDGLTVTGGGYVMGAGSGWTVSHVGDFDGDGKADLLLTHTDGSIYVQTMNGITATGGTFLQGAGTGWSVTHVADFNGDGKSDILLKHTDGSIYVWQMNGIAIQTGTFLKGAGIDWSATATGDFNGDRKADILITHTNGGVYEWLMNGIAIQTGTYLLSPGSGWSIAKTGDLDGDGKSDIVIKHTDGSHYAWMMNGVNIASGGYLLGAGTGWSVNRLIDLDGDGKSDILIEHTDGSIYAWIMNGATITNGGYLMGAGPWRVVP